MKILVTGVLGFIGSNFARYILQNTNHHIVGLNRATDSRSLMRIADLESKQRFNLILRDLTADISGVCEDVDWVVNFAAKTFVDHSIRDPAPFISSNIVGTYNLLEEFRRSTTTVKRFIQFSTDEVYGAILSGSYNEDARLNPTNPYSAAKAAADMLCRAYFNTYGLPIIITRTENNFGPWQHKQKALPVFIRCALEDNKLPVYGDGKHARMWLHVEDTCKAVLKLFEHGVDGEIYHIAGEHELQNLELAKMILRLLGKPEDRIEFKPDFNIRPGHDRRYALDSTKMRNLGWNTTAFDRALKETVDWYIENQWWLT